MRKCLQLFPFFIEIYVSNCDEIFSVATCMKNGCNLLPVFMTECFSQASGLLTIEVFSLDLNIGSDLSWLQIISNDFACKFPYWKHQHFNFLWSSKSPKRVMKYRLSMTVSLQKTLAFQDIPGHFLWSRKSPKRVMKYWLCMTVCLQKTPAFKTFLDISFSPGNLLNM